MSKGYNALMDAFLFCFRATFFVTEKGATRRPSKPSTENNKMNTDTFGAFGHKYFEVDHPFIFMVWDYYSGMFLLMGRVMNPDIILT